MMLLDFYKVNLYLHQHIYNLLDLYNSHNDMLLKHFHHHIYIQYLEVVDKIPLHPCNYQMRSNRHIRDRSQFFNKIGYPSTHIDYREDFDNNQYIATYLSNPKNICKIEDYFAYRHNKDFGSNYNHNLRLNCTIHYNLYIHCILGINYLEYLPNQ